MTTITIDKKIVSWKIANQKEELTEENKDISKRLREEYKSRLEKEIGHILDENCEAMKIYDEIDKSFDKKDQQSIHQNDRPEKIKRNAGVRRPKELPCDIHQIKIKGEAWTIFVGLLDNVPYEIFGGLSKYVEIPKKYKQGTLIKNGKVNGISTYNLILGKEDDQLTIKDVVNIFENTTQGSFTRLVSLSLRHGVPVEYICEQLNKDQFSDITSFSKCIARVLKNYIVEKKIGAICPKCSSNNVVCDGGCLRCLDCCYEKCG